MDKKLAGERLLAQRVKALREARGWSQTDLAQRVSEAGCSIHQTAISRIEKSSAKDGRRAIALDEAIAFAQAFDVPLDRLIAPTAENVTAQESYSRYSSVLETKDTLSGVRDRAVVKRDAALAQYEIAEANVRYTAKLFREAEAMVKDEFNALVDIVDANPVAEEWVRNKQPLTWTAILEDRPPASEE